MAFCNKPPPSMLGASPFMLRASPYMLRTSPYMLRASPSMLGASPSMLGASPSLPWCMLYERGDNVNLCNYSYKHMFYKIYPLTSYTTSIFQGFCSRTNAFGVSWSHKWIFALTFSRDALRKCYIRTSLWIKWSFAITSKLCWKKEENVIAYLSLTSYIIDSVHP